MDAVISEILDKAHARALVLDQKRVIVHSVAPSPINLNDLAPERRVFEALAHDIENEGRAIANEQDHARCNRICTRADMIVTSGKSAHLKQEAEANRFAITLLAPVRRLAPYLAGPADLEAVLAMATDLDISKAAAVRRYVEIHYETLAVVFSRDDLVLYADRRGSRPCRSGKGIGCRS